MAYRFIDKTERIGRPGCVERSMVPYKTRSRAAQASGLFNTRRRIKKPFPPRKVSGAKP